MSTLLSNTIKPSSGDTVTFSDCNVSVGGTVSYEDVTNIDSVGIITARGGIEVGASGVGGTITAAGDATLPGGLDVIGIITATSGNVTGIVTATGGIELGASGVGGTITAAGYATLPCGLNVTGVVTATSFSGDGSTLSGVEPGVVNFVASGAISNGATVVINDDGTVGIVTQTTSSTPTAGTPVVFNSGSTSSCSPVYDPVNKKVVIAYKDAANSDYGTAIVGTVSGDTITFGSAATFVSDTFEKGSIAFDSTNGKAVIVWRDGSSPNYGKAVVGTVSGTSISFGTVATFVSAYTGETATTFDSTNGKVVIVYADASSSNRGKSVVGTVSGTDISFGTVATFESGASGTSDLAATFDSTNGKVVLVYKDDNNSAYGTAIVATVSGTDISFGTAVVYESANASLNSAVYDSVNGKVVISYQDQGNSSYGTAVVGTVSGTSISFGTPLVYESATISDMGSTYDSTNEKVVIAYRDNGNSYYGTAVVFSAMLKSTNLTATNYIGIAGEAIANTSTGKINVVGGVNSGQSGLTTAKTYYVGQTGILTTTADTPSVVAGTSISDTKVVVWRS